MDAFTEAYIECALWSSSDTTEEGEEIRLDDGEHELAEETMAAMVEDCRQFQESNAELLERAGSPAQNGHDFWLTRCGHGAGFWDRGYSDGIGDLLSDICREIGNVDLYIGSDGLIYAA